ncbi:hypothetical protein FB567DRAFT_615817 [Paraphoma chrysanthemicola]|uniref:RING-type domain-containing protein n=1 Tax=Paraphoma chrysanthemicola TaxID=798071 RepID=A0A8K0QT14_9PLEO|nr:hypothetical protein FB567DRAFT_615817 [Paraphoma chrysanthemicola]
MGLNHSKPSHSTNNTQIPSHNVNDTTPVAEMSALTYTPAVFSEIANALYEEIGSGTVDITSPTYLELMDLMKEFHELDICFDDWLQNHPDTMGPDVRQLVLQLFHSEESEEADSGLHSSSFPAGEEGVSITIDVFEHLDYSDNDTDDDDSDFDSDFDDLTEEETLQVLAEFEAVEDSVQQGQAEQIAQLSFVVGAFISECTFLAKPDAVIHEDFAHHQATFDEMKSEIVELGIKVGPWLDDAGVYVDLASSLPESAQVMTFILNHFEDWAGQPGVPKRRISQAKVKKLVDTLEKVEIAGIAKEDGKCPHCWGRWDAEDEENGCKDPVKTLCGHVFGRACLVTALTGTRLRCPMCRQKMHAAA